MNCRVVATGGEFVVVHQFMDVLLNVLTFCKALPEMEFRVGRSDPQRSGSESNLRQVIVSVSRREIFSPRNRNRVDGHEPIEVSSYSTLGKCVWTVHSGFAIPAHPALNFCDLSGPLILRKLNDDDQPVLKQIMTAVIAVESLSTPKKA
jgi:hypothetical protein